MNSAKLIKQIKADGWVLVHTVGSHHQFKHPTKPGKVTVPHPKKICHCPLCAASSSRPACEGRLPLQESMPCFTPSTCTSVTPSARMV